MRMLQLWALIDTRAKTIVGPVVHDHSAVPLIRQITEAVNKPGTLINQSPADFAIFHLGEIDEETGQIIAADEPAQLTTALALKTASE